MRQRLMVLAWPETRTVTHVACDGAWVVLPRPIVVPAGHQLELAMVAPTSDVDRLLATLGIPLPDVTRKD